jgi:hypothetical protein
MADRHEIAEEIERLAIHCRPPLMSVEDRSMWLEDWCRDLAEYPIDAIRTACQRWRNGADRKFPLPGHLKPLVASAARPLGKGPTESVEPWRQLTDDEYQRLSLSEKIRHHRILASEALRKAGPMWRNGGPIAVEDMPEAWHIWKRKAEGHHAEAARLQKNLKRDEAA